MNAAKRILTFIIKEKADGNTFQELNIQMKIMMKGVNVKGILDNKIHDTPALIEQLNEIAKEFEVDLQKMTAS
jgi:hypothetical protein